MNNLIDFNSQQMQAGNIQSGTQFSGNYSGIIQQGTQGLTQYSNPPVPNYQYFPYYIQHNNNYITISSASIQQVENGWLVIKNNKVFIAKTKEEIIAYL